MAAVRSRTKFRWPSGPLAAFSSVSTCGILRVPHLRVVQFNAPPLPRQQLQSLAEYLVEGLLRIAPGGLFDGFFRQRVLVA